MNNRNYAFTIGRLASNPKFVENKDKSKKVFVTLAVQVPSKDKNGNYVQNVEFLEFEDFVPKDLLKSKYDYLKKGMLVQIQHETRSVRYTKDNEIRYKQFQRITNVDFGLETKESVENRDRNKNVEQSQDELINDHLVQDETFELPFETE